MPAYVVGTGSKRSSLSNVCVTSSLEKLAHVAGPQLFAEALFHQMGVKYASEFYYEETGMPINRSRGRGFALDTGCRLAQDRNTPHDLGNG
jgi:hypothetical protein